MCAAILRGLRQWLWQLCRVHERQLDPNMMQSQPHYVYCSFTFFFIYSTYRCLFYLCFSLPSSSLLPRSFFIPLSVLAFLFPLRYWNPCIPELPVSVNKSVCTSLLVCELSSALQVNTLHLQNSNAFPVFSCWVRKGSSMSGLETDVLMQSPFQKNKNIYTHTHTHIYIYIYTHIYKSQDKYNWY